MVLILDMAEELVDLKTSGSNLIFRSDKSRRDQYLEDIEFFDAENDPKNVHIYSACKELKGQGKIRVHSIQFHSHSGTQIRVHSIQI